MTDITKLALRLKTAAEKAKHAGETPVMPFDARISALNEYQITACPDNILALVAALEKAQQRIAELEESNAQVIQSRDHYKRMTDEGLKQLAEARTVKLPDDAEHDIMAPVAAYLSEKFKWDGGAARWDGRKEYDVLADRVKYALRMVIRRAAGIKVEAE